MSHKLNPNQILELIAHQEASSFKKSENYYFYRTDQSP